MMQSMFHVKHALFYNIFYQLYLLRKNIIYFLGEGLFFSSSCFKPEGL